MTTRIHRPYRSAFPVWKPIVATALIVATAAVLLIAGKARAEDQPAQDQPAPCFAAATVYEQLRSSYGEEPVVRALASDGSLLEIWASEGGKTWTQIAVTPSGIACVLGAGRAIEVRHRTDEQGDPA